MMMVFHTVLLKSMLKMKKQPGFHVTKLVGSFAIDKDTYVHRYVHTYVHACTYLKLQCLFFSEYCYLPTERTTKTCQAFIYKVGLSCLHVIGYPDFDLYKLQGNYYDPGFCAYEDTYDTDPWCAIIPGPQNWTDRSALTEMVDWDYCSKDCKCSTPSHYLLRTTFFKLFSLD